MILSPGPGRPEDAGMIVEAVKILGKEIPILGVCLGHQAICAAFGSTITYAKERMHGKQSDVKFDIIVRCLWLSMKLLPLPGIILLQQMPTQFPNV